MMSERVQSLMDCIVNDPLVTLVRNNHPAGPWNLFLVGGTIRDILLARPLMDRDFVVEGDALEFAKRLAVAIGARYVPLEEQWDTVRLVISQTGKAGRKLSCNLDFSGLRGGTIRDDLLQRDFTVNAMAVLLPKDIHLPPGPLHDFSGGLEDIEKGIIRVVRPQNLEADPLRVLRAFRLSCSLGFDIHPETMESLALHAAKIQASAGERIRDELMKLLGSPSSLSVLRKMESVGLLWELFPELVDLQELDQGHHHPHDAWRHGLETLSAFESLAARGFADLCPYDLSLRNDMGRRPQTLPLLKMAALVHDIGKPMTRSLGNDGRVHFYGHEHTGARITLQIAKRFRLSRMDQSALWTLVRYHMWPLHMSIAESRARLNERAKVRFFRRLGANAIGVLLVALADDMAKAGNDPLYGPTSPFIAYVRSLLGLYYSRDAAGIWSPPLLTGHDLMQHFGLKPGPQVGRIIEAIHEARVQGKVHSREEALELVSGILNRN